MSGWSEEADRVQGAWRLQLRMDRMLCLERSRFQEIAVFENSLYGRVLALDGVVQTTEADEFFYHEMLVHVPLPVHGAVERALIIGGGDGGALEELLKHAGHAHVTLVEIDGAVIEVAKRHLRPVCGDAFDDPRLELAIADGLAWVGTCDERFDLILIDSTDPFGPGEALFSTGFYADCARILRDDGVLVTQNAIPFAEPDSISKPIAALRRAFPRAACYRAVVPSFYGGEMAFTIAARGDRPLAVPADVLETRFAAAAIDTRYYTPAVHQGAFALPPYLAALVGKEALSGS